MKFHKSLTDERVIDAIREDCDWGFCVHCGSQVDGVEPDAEKYACELCGKRGVFGAEQLLFYLER